jgi:hypothetical protein
VGAAAAATAVAVASSSSSPSSSTSSSSSIFSNCSIVHSKGENGVFKIYSENFPSAIRNRKNTIFIPMGLQ